MPASTWRVRKSATESEAVPKWHPEFPILHGLGADIFADARLNLRVETLALLDGTAHTAGQDQGPEESRFPRGADRG
jgi:hypothetical protein